MVTNACRRKHTPKCKASLPLSDAYLAILTPRERACLVAACATHGCLDTPPPPVPPEHVTCSPEELASYVSGLSYERHAEVTRERDAYQRALGARTAPLTAFTDAEIRSAYLVALVMRSPGDSDQDVLRGFLKALATARR